MSFLLSLTLDEAEALVELLDETEELPHVLDKLLAAMETPQMKLASQMRDLCKSIERYGERNGYTR